MFTFTAISPATLSRLGLFRMRLPLVARLLTCLVSGRVPPARRGCVIYVDPCTDDIFDNRLETTREACEAYNVELVPI